METIKGLLTSKRMGVLLVAALSYVAIHFGITLSDADRAALEQGVPVLITTVGLVITKVIDSRKK